MAFPFDELRKCARAAIFRPKRAEIRHCVLFHTLSLGFVTGLDRSIQAFPDRFVEIADWDEPAYTSFTYWLFPAFVALPRDLLDAVTDDLDLGRNYLRGRREHFRNVLIVDATFISLYQDATDI